MAIALEIICIFTHFEGQAKDTRDARTHTHAYVLYVEGENMNGCPLWGCKWGQNF